MRYPTHTPKQIQALMAQFAYEMLKWVKTGCNINQPYNNKFGLCFNWNQFIDKATEEKIYHPLYDMFYNTIFDMKGYRVFGKEPKDHKLHLYGNPRRIAWLKVHAKRHKPARKPKKAPNSPV